MTDEPRVRVTMSVADIDEQGGTITVEEEIADLTNDVAEVSLDQFERIAKRLSLDPDSLREVLKAERRKIRDARFLKSLESATERRHIEAIEAAAQELAKTRSFIDPESVPVRYLPDPPPDPVRRGRVVPRRSKPSKPDPSPIAKLRALAGVRDVEPDPTPNLSDLRRRAGV